jgi:hypothetical protein
MLQVGGSIFHGKGSLCCYMQIIKDRSVMEQTPNECFHINRTTGDWSVIQVVGFSDYAIFTVTDITDSISRLAFFCAYTCTCTTRNSSSLC